MHRPAAAWIIRATREVPSGPTTACGVSTWISKRRVPGAGSSRSATSTIASTWATEVTLGSVTTKPSGICPSVSRNVARVRMPRARVPRSRLLNRMPWNGLASPASIDSRSAAAADLAAASSSSSDRTP